MSALHALLQDLKSHYLRIAPDAEAVHALLKARGETLQNDHLALRTFDRPGYDLENLSAIFLDAGYTQSGQYTFPNKHLVAKSFQREDSPHVFISHLVTDSFSENFQDIIDAVIQSGAPTAREALVSGEGFNVHFETYQTLAEESEYAAWVSAFGICANHFTVSVNALKSFGSPPDLRLVNRTMREAGFIFNGRGDFVQGAPELLLEQSSTKARSVKVQFSDREAKIPGAYVEFAKRYLTAEGGLYAGFVTDSADRIFESTNERS